MALEPCGRQPSPSFNIVRAEDWRVWVPLDLIGNLSPTFWGYRWSRYLNGEKILLLGSSGEGVGTAFQYFDQTIGKQTVTFTTPRKVESQNQYSLKSYIFIGWDIVLNPKTTDIWLFDWSDQGLTTLGNSRFGKIFDCRTSRDLELQSVFNYLENIQRANQRNNWTCQVIADPK